MKRGKRDSSWRLTPVLAITLRNSFRSQTFLHFTHIRWWSDDGQFSTTDGGCLFEWNVAIAMVFMFIAHSMPSQIQNVICDSFVGSAFWVSADLGFTQMFLYVRLNGFASAISTVIILLSIKIRRRTQLPLIVWIIICSRLFIALALSSFLLSFTY